MSGVRDGGFEQAGGHRVNYASLVMPAEEEPKPVGLERIFYWRMLPRYEARWRFVSDQLASRDHTTRDAWGDDDVSLRVLDVVAEAIRKEFFWPNVNYLPGDPLLALCVRRDWERELIAVIFDIRKYLDLPRHWHGALKLLPTMTFGEFVDNVVFIYCQQRERAGDSGSS